MSLYLALVLLAVLAVGAGSCAAPVPAPGPDPEPLPEIGPLWDFSDPAGTEARFRGLLPRAEAAGDRGYRAELLSQIARTQGLRQLFAEADRTLDEAEVLLDGTTPRARVRCLLERGRVRNSSNRRPESLPFFERAWDEARAEGLHGLAVDAAHMLGIAAAPEAALEWNERAIAYAEECGDPGAGAWLGALYNNTGWTHFAAGRHGRALELFEKALRWQKEKERPAEVLVARWCVAKAWRVLGRVEEALAEQRLLEEAWRARGEPDGFVHEEVGECLFALGRREEARPAFALAHGILSADPWLTRDEPERLARLARLAAGADE